MALNLDVPLLDSIPKSMPIHLHNARGSKLASFSMPYRSDRPRVIVWQWRTFIQRVSGESPDYFEADSHWLHG